jgi:hypothetical protein
MGSPLPHLSAPRLAVQAMSYQTEREAALRALAAAARRALRAKAKVQKPPSPKKLADQRAAELRERNIREAFDGQA